MTGGLGPGSTSNDLPVGGGDESRSQTIPCCSVLMFKQLRFRWARGAVQGLGFGVSGLGFRV